MRWDDSWRLQDSNAVNERERESFTGTLKMWISKHAQVCPHFLPPSPVCIERSPPRCSPVRKFASISCLLTRCVHPPTRWRWRTSYLMPVPEVVTSLTRHRCPRWTPVPSSCLFPPMQLYIYHPHRPTCMRTYSPTHIDKAVHLYISTLCRSPIPIRSCMCMHTM